MKKWRILPLALGLLVPHLQSSPVTVGGVPGLDPGQFRITTFVSGFNSSTVITGASAGGLLVGSGFAAARVTRLTDLDSNGLADGPGSVVIQLTGPGAITSITNAGPFVALGVKGQGIRLFAPNADPDAPYTDLGSLQLGFSAGYFHDTPGVATRATPGSPGSYDLFFSVGSPGNATAGPPLALSGLLNGSVNAQSAYKVTLTPNGSGGWTASGLTQVASGLRNALGLGIHPATGDLYLLDNGIDGLIDDREPEGADTLDRIPAAALGGPPVDFGFPNRYVQYRTNLAIGGPSNSLVAFQPTPDPFTGSEAEGASGLAFSPSGFPGAVNRGVFLSFYGQSGTPDGLANEENPILYYDFVTGQYSEFISNNEAGVRFPVGLYSTANSLFMVDLGRGEVTQITAVPEPASALLVAAALAGWWFSTRRFFLTTTK